MHHLPKDISHTTGSMRGTLEKTAATQSLYLTPHPSPSAESSSLDTRPCEAAAPSAGESGSCSSSAPLPSGQDPQGATLSDLTFHVTSCVVPLIVRTEER